MHSDKLAELSGPIVKGIELLSVELEGRERRDLVPQIIRSFQARERGSVVGKLAPTLHPSNVSLPSPKSLKISVDKFHLQPPSLLLYVT